MNAFEIKELPGRGRGMVATKNFAVDDVILEEEPFVSHQFSWNAAYEYAACDHCMRPLETILENVRRLSNKPNLTMNLQEHDPTAQWLPQFTICPRCKVRYCSEDCRMEAFNRYHKVGCLAASREDATHPINVLNEVWKTMHYPPETGSIMLLVRLMAIYQQSSDKQKFLQDLQSFQSSAVNAEQQIYHKILGENFAAQMEELYTVFCRAFDDEMFAMFTTPTAFKSLLALMGMNSQGIATSVLAEWTRKLTKLPFVGEEKLRIDKYIDDIYKQVSEFAGEFLNNEGAGLYLYQSKVNHSCYPNAHSTFPYSNDIVVLKAITPIKAGDEICISYLDECQLERSRHSRQKILKENYIFICDCAKCKFEADCPDETSAEDDDYDDDSMSMDDEDNMQD